MFKSIEIRISYSYLLDPFFAKLFLFNKEKGLFKEDLLYPQKTDIETKIQKFKEVWSDESNEVIAFMQNTMELEFKKSIIDVYIVGMLKGAISSPIVIGSNMPLEDFTLTLIHELIHNLISDNERQLDVVEILQRMYPEESVLTRNHILVHALIKKIYNDHISNSTVLDRIQQNNKNHADYDRAWEIVNQEGYEEVLEKFRRSYSKI